MTGGDSVFSCIKQQAVRNEREFHAPPPVPQPPPPPPPRQQEDLCAKMAGLEAKIKILGERDCAAAAATEGFKAEAQAARRHAAELERELAWLKKTIEDSVRDNRAGRDAICAAIAQLKEEQASRHGGASSVDKTTQTGEQFGLSSGSLAVGLLEGRLKNLETGLVNELKERFSTLDKYFGETARKAGLAQETAAGSARRVEKLEEEMARLPYLENRVNAGAEKLERIYDLEALCQSLKFGVQGMEKHFSASMMDFSALSAEHKQFRSDLDSLSHNVKQLAALFNQLRAELAFLMPKKRGVSAESRDNSYGDI